ncbi:hypothetical protein [Calothrix sp. NIES-3974]|uniref:hypothetical protein n=1 Tax=Calothrix sp. NIES-3974 TaxID=2005462 RepID=UPI000B5F6408|nr:hypothetical protein [Calothrix sp. NIES-3974]BAZ05593.1 hypothetical protein NIES3974_22440 [Calothrix sp. NIES-3974]
MQFNIRRLFYMGYAIAGGGLFSLTVAPASAQLTIETTGTISGTIQLPSFNPNFNSRITEVMTDSTGTYFRNIGTRNNPNYVPVYTSNHVRFRTNADGSLSYYVNFRGIPVVSFDSVITSPILSEGELTPFNYQGRLPGVKMQAVVQDELSLGRAFYTGIVTDPNTGNRYQGTFELRGQGPRYSDRNGGDSPTVFDFKSDLPGTPTVTSANMENVPLVRLRVTVPADAQLLSPTTGGGGTDPVVTNPGTTNPGTTNPGTTNPVVSNPGTTNPVVSNPGTTNPVVSNPGTTNPGTGTNPIAVNNPVGNTIVTPTPDLGFNLGGVVAIASNPDGTIPEVEFSDGRTYQLTPEIAKICAEAQIQCRMKQPQTQKSIGPRSRVLVR